MKGLDGETEYYYYGARYYNPRVSLCVNVNPLAKLLLGRSPYEYILSNPIKFTSPMGIEPEGLPSDNKAKQQSKIFQYVELNQTSIDLDEERKAYKNDDDGSDTIFIGRQVC